jgi:poly(glycerol-phosphate) alpha-glucosyltransferase
VTWSIPDDFGGMTRAMLQRSQAFVRLGGATVDILTFDARSDYPMVEQRLRFVGDLIEGMRLVNLYDWLRENPLPGGSLRLDRHPFDPIEAAAPGITARDALTRVRTADDGTVLQVDHLRRDGTLLLSDRRDVRQRGTLGGRSVVLCDESGRPVRSWGRIHHLYTAWLNRLVGRSRAFMIVDSKTIAPFMLGYRRPRVTTVHVVHNSHLGSRGAFRSTRREVLENSDQFDSVVVLTERQRRDLLEALGPVDNLAVIPNAVPPGDPGALDRDPYRGVVIASLTSRKRVDHAVRAIRDVANPDVALDIYGDGELRESLEDLAATTGGAVRLHGYRSDARRELADASFILATGSSEGMPLVLIESMAAGCIPIAYDVPYGPSDVIDGVNGILVPSGDVSALTEAVRSLVAEPPAQLARRRRRARRTALRFSDEVITARWARELRLAARRHERAFAGFAARVDATAVRRAS